MKKLKLTLLAAIILPMTLILTACGGGRSTPPPHTYQIPGTFNLSHIRYIGVDFQLKHFDFSGSRATLTTLGEERIQYLITTLSQADKNIAVYHYLSWHWLDWDNVDRIHAQFIQLLNFELGSLLPLTTQDRENALTQIPSIRDIKDFPIAQPMITEMQDMIQDIYTNNSWAQQSFMSDVIHERIARVFLQGRQEYLANLIGTPRFYEYLHIVIRNMLLSRIRPLRFGTEILLAYESTVHDEHGFFWINEQGEVIVSGRVEFYGTLPSFVICKETRTLTGETGDNTRIVFRQI